MSFNDTYRESIQDKHLANVGFTSTAKGVTNEATATKNPHQVLASQIPAIDVVTTYGPLTASGIAAGMVEEHIVELTADPTVNNNLAWLAYDGSVRLDQWMRYAETQYKLRLFADTGGGAPDYSTEILPSYTGFDWEYNSSAGTVYFDSDPSANFTIPLWGVFYTYIGPTVSDEFGPTASGGTASGISVNTDNFDGVLSPSDYNVQKALDTIDDIKFFQTISNSVTSFDADTNADTLTFSGTGGTTILTEASTNTVIIHSSAGGYGHPHTHHNVDLYYLSGDTWATSGTGLLLLPDDLEVFLNGIKQRANNLEYYTPTVISGNLYVEFGFTVANDNWVSSSYDVEAFVPMHMHHDVDMNYVIGSTWSYDGGFAIVPSGINLSVNGAQQRNNSDYYIASISGTSLIVDFSFTVDAGSWVNLEYISE